MKELSKENDDNIKKGIVCVFGLINEALKKELNEPPPKVPEYIERLINEGFLYPDGKRVVRRLEDIAYWLSDDLKMPITEKFLAETFLKADGKSYSPSACKHAINMAENRPAKSTTPTKGGGLNGKAPK
ncbi:MAG: hypothetical protein LBJ31_10105 [Treponema sp.]|jgi:hypothetical protein|nr:hypothetical protein [Treponema sp.]